MTFFSYFGICLLEDIILTSEGKFLQMKNEDEESKLQAAQDQISQSYPVL